MKVGNQRTHCSQRSNAIAFAVRVVKFGELDGSFRGICLRGVQGEQSVSNELGLLRFIPESLDKSFAGPQANADERKFAAGCEEICKEARQIDDGMIGIEGRSQQSCGSCAGGVVCRSDEQMSGFIEGEKKASRGGMGNGQGASLQCLLGKDLRDAATGGEDIAEPESCATLGEHNHLSDAFGGAHDGSGLDGLVRG